jgi:hypothetical protein
MRPALAALILFALASPSTAPLAAEPTTAVTSAPESSTPATAPATPTPAAGSPATPPTPAAPATPAVPVKKPALVVAQPVHEAGKVHRGDAIEAVFTLENHGDGDLVIKSADPSCGCTVASFDRKIAPGATGMVRARVDTGGFAGAISKGVTVLSNDPTNPRVVLTIHADVQADVLLAPTYARILQVQTQDAAKAQVRLWCEDGTALEIRGVHSPKPWIQASARRAEAGELDAGKPAPQWIVEVALTGDAPLGPLGESIGLDTNHPRQPVVELPLSGFVRPLLATVPEIADYGTLGPGANKSRFVLKLFNFGKGDVTVTSATSDLRFLTVSVSPEDRGRRFRIQLDLAADAPKGKFEGKLRIETTSPVMPVLEVPVRGKVG